MQYIFHITQSLKNINISVVTYKRETSLAVILFVCFSSWTNLEDLQVWLSVREVQYQYRDMEEFKGAVYTGKWEMGKPHGM